MAMASLARRKVFSLIGFESSGHHRRRLRGIDQGGSAWSRKTCIEKGRRTRWHLSQRRMHSLKALSGVKSKLLLSAKKARKATGAEFVVSLSRNDFSRSSSNYIGKLRSNLVIPCLISVHRVYQPRNPEDEEESVDGFLLRELRRRVKTSRRDDTSNSNAGV
ncbi:unnamed protein product [Microthlaspi erraticum]|uniref:Tubby C-terminal domain-containing protein n=1 Tax=Microthlaspi erraticum TaxID=1685480 RepID=A0A6D2K9U5_9BRAS|nr:unnamed protein product [Microthlaspi erraticum]